MALRLSLLLLPAAWAVAPETDCSVIASSAESEFMESCKATVNTTACSAWPQPGGKVVACRFTCPGSEARSTLTGGNFYTAAGATCGKQAYCCDAPKDLAMDTVMEGSQVSQYCKGQAYDKSAQALASWDVCNLKEAPVTTTMQASGAAIPNVAFAATAALSLLLLRR